MQNIESKQKYVFIQDFPIGKDSSRYLLQAYVNNIVQINFLHAYMTVYTSGQSPLQNINAKYWKYKKICFYSRFSNWERHFQVSSTSICNVTSDWLPEVTTATLLEATSAISHSDRGSDSHREEMCHFGGTSRSYLREVL